MLFMHAIFLHAQLFALRSAQVKSSGHAAVRLHMASNIFKLGQVLRARLLTALEQHGCTWKAQSMERNVWPMTKVNRKFTATVSPWPADRVSSG